MNACCRFAAIAAFIYATGLQSATAGLVAHWKNDEGTGQIANDSAGSNPGTLGLSNSPGTDDPTWTTGVIGGALDFDGSNDLVRVPHAAGLLPTNQMTASIWFRRDRTGVREVVYGKGDGATDATTSFWLEINASNQLNYYLSVTNGGPAIGSNLTVATTVTDTTTWHNFATTYDGATKRLFLDGNLVGTAGLVGTAINNPARDLAYGKLGQCCLNSDGPLDDVGLWSNALSDAKVKAIYTLALEPTLNFNLGIADQLFQTYDNQTALFLDPLLWSYQTGLATPVGVVTLIGDKYYLRLDISGAGLLGQTPPVPEPNTFALVALGSVGLVLRRRGKRGTPAIPRGAFTGWLP